MLSRKERNKLMNEIILIDVMSYELLYYKSPQKRKEILHTIWDSLDRLKEL